MTSSIKVQNEVSKLREEVMHSFRTYLPSKEFSTRMVLALIWLHLLVKRIEVSCDLNERRKLLQELTRSKSLIEHWTKTLKQTGYRRVKAGDSKTQWEAKVNQAKHNGIVHFKKQRKA